MNACISDELERQLCPAFDAVMDEVKMVGHPVRWYAEHAPWAVVDAVRRHVDFVSWSNMPEDTGFGVGKMNGDRFWSDHPNIAIAALDAYTKSLVVTP